MVTQGRKRSMFMAVAQAVVLGGRELGSEWTLATGLCLGEVAIEREHRRCPWPASIAKKEERKSSQVNIPINP